MPLEIMSEVVDGDINVESGPRQIAALLIRHRRRQQPAPRM